MRNTLPGPSRAARDGFCLSSHPQGASTDARGRAAVEKYFKSLAGKSAPAFPRGLGAVARCRALLPLWQITLNKYMFVQPAPERPTDARVSFALVAQHSAEILQAP